MKQGRSWLPRYVYTTGVLLQHEPRCTANGDQRSMTQNDGADWDDTLWRVAADRYEERLRQYLLKRLGCQKANDLLQEIYIRLLRVPRSEFIRDPEVS